MLIDNEGTNHAEDLLEEEIAGGDSDDAALAAALEEVKAETAEAAAKPEGEGEGEGEPAAEPEGADKSGGEGEPEADKGMVPHEVVGGLRQKLRQTAEELAESRAQQKILRSLAKSGALTPEALATVLGEDGEGGGAPEVTVDPYSDINARELVLEKQREDGDINGVEYRTQMQALQAERRAIDKAELQKEIEQRETTTVISRISAATKQMEQRWPVLKTITGQQLQSCRPAAEARLQGELDKRFGEGTAYNPNNEQHVLLIRWLTCDVADKVFGEGKGPIRSGQQQNPKVGKDGKPLSPNQIHGSPPAKAPAARAAASAEEKLPPDVKQFSFDAGTELGNIERSILTMDEDQLDALLKSRPDVARKLEGRT